MKPLTKSQLQKAIKLFKAEIKHYKEAIALAEKQLKEIDK